MARKIRGTAHPVFRHGTTCHIPTPDQLGQKNLIDKEFDMATAIAKALTTSIKDHVKDPEVLNNIAEEFKQRVEEDQVG